VPNFAQYRKLLHELAYQVRVVVVMSHAQHLDGNLLAIVTATEQISKRTGRNLL
jgi:hypothetical protein